MKNYKFAYKIEPFADTFKLTIVAESEDDAIKKWKKSILSYHATLINVTESEEG